MSDALRATEKQVTVMVRRFYATVGCETKSTSQARRSKIALGLPDLLVFWKARGVFFWHEAKRPGGTLRPEQAAFKALSEACGVTVVVGGLPEAVAHVNQVRGVDSQR